MIVKSQPLPDDILGRLPKAQAYLNGRPEAAFAYLFGGLAKGEPTPLSDVDIAVYVAEGHDPAQAKVTLLGGLVSILATDEIDLVVLNTAPLPLRARIVGRKRILKDSEPFLRHKFESLTLREYFDFSVKEKDILARRYSLGR